MQRHAGSISSSVNRLNSPLDGSPDEGALHKEPRVLRSLPLGRLLERCRPAAGGLLVSRVLLAAATLAVVLLKLRSSLAGQTAPGLLTGETAQVAVLLLPSPVVGPGSRSERLQAMHETWGSCLPQIQLQVVVATDDLAADSSAAPPSSSSSSSSLPPTAFLSFPPHLGPDADGLRRLGWALGEAVRRVPGLGFLVLGNDHTFLLPHNLLAFLRPYSPHDPLSLGHRLQIDEHTVFHSGAAGLVLSRAALDLLLPALEEGKEGCATRNDWESRNAGVVLSGCLGRLGVPATDTTVAGSGGGQRFNVYGPARLATGEVDEWYVRYHEGQGHEAEGGGGAAWQEVVSFHYVGPSEARALWHVLNRLHWYREQQAGGASWRELSEAAHWPTSSEALGGYSRPANQAMWDLLLHNVTLHSQVGASQARARRR